MSFITQELERYQAKRERDRKHRAWMRRVYNGIPALAARVFALRGTMYSGCGMHYQMESDLAKVMRLCNPARDLREDDIGTLVIDQVITEGLYEDLRKAEQSAKELKERHG